MSKPEDTTSTPMVEKKIEETIGPVISEGDKELDAIFGSRMRQRVILVDQEDEEEEVEESSTSNKPSKSNRKRNKKNYASKGRNNFKEY
jgi:hypothetical protein